MVAVPRVRQARRRREEWRLRVRRAREQLESALPGRRRPALAARRQGREQPAERRRGPELPGWQLQLRARARPVAALQARRRVRGLVVKGQAPAWVQARQVQQAAAVPVP